MNINKFNITKSDYEIVANDFGIDFALGAGIDMNSDKPIVRNSLLKTQDVPKISNVVQNEWRQSTVEYIESSKIEEYFKALSISIKGSYSTFSARANYDRVTKEQKDYFMVIILITDKSINNYSLNIEEIKETPYSENSTENDEIKTWQFLQDYGSHFINKITFGYQIAFEAKVDKRQYSDEMNFSASINAAYGAFSASGSINMTEVNKLKAKGVTISGRITSGGIKPDRPLTIGSIDDLTDLMLGLSNGSKIIKRGPYKLYLQSYWSKLTSYPNSRKLLQPEFSQTVKADYGVPTGTIIAYYPPIDINVPELLKDNEFYWVPKGWAVCNGLNETPNLTDKFIMGCSKEELASTGGSITHKHELSQVDYDTLPDGSNEKNGTIIHPANHLPPYVKLIYIIRK